MPTRELNDMARRGQISPANWAKLKAQMGGAKQPTRLAEFDGKGGLKDQGGIHDKGDKAGGRSHIDNKQDMGAPARASGKPSKGGSVNATGQPGRGEIDEAKTQSPLFPKGSKTGSAKRPALKAVKRDQTQSGPEYGGPNSRKYG
jgi:hypothetical protein